MLCATCDVDLCSLCLGHCTCDHSWEVRDEVRDV